MVVGAAGDQRRVAVQEALGERLGVVCDVLRVGLERRGAGFGQGDGLCCHHVGERAAEHQWAAAVHGRRVLAGRQDHAAARAAQRLVRRGGDDIGVGHRVLVAREHLACDQTREVRHVDHQHRANLVSDLAHLGEVHAARVGGVAGDDDERLELARLRGEGVVVEQLGLGVGAVGTLVEHLARHVGPEAVRQVAACIEGHAEQALLAEAAAQVLPVGLAEVSDALDAELGECGRLDLVREDRPVGGQVRVDAGVGLDVGVLGAEQFAGVLGRDRLDGVDVLAAGVEAVTDRTLGVLVAHPGAHGGQHRKACVVLRRDQLQRVALIGEFLPGGRGDPRFDGLNHAEQGLIRRRDRLEIAHSSPQIGRDVDTLSRSARGARLGRGPWAADELP